MKTCARTGDKHVALFGTTRFLMYAKLKKKVWRYVTLYLQILLVFLLVLNRSQILTITVVPESLVPSLVLL